MQSDPLDDPSYHDDEVFRQGLLASQIGNCSCRYCACAGSNCRSLPAGRHNVVKDDGKGGKGGMNNKTSKGKKISKHWMCVHLNGDKYMSPKS